MAQTKLQKLRRSQSPVSPTQAAIMQRLERAAQNVEGDDDSTMAIVVAPDKSILVDDNFIIHPTHLEIIGDVSSQSWLKFVRWVKSLDATVQWVLGDAMVLADEKREEWLSQLEPGDETDEDSKYKALIESSGYSYSSLTKFASFARQFPPFRRRKGIDYSIYPEIASLSQTQQDALLDRAETEDMSVRALRQAVTEIKYPGGENSNAATPPPEEIEDNDDDDIDDAADVVHEKRVAGFRKKAAAKRYAEIDMDEIISEQNYLARLRKIVARAKVEADKQARMKARQR